MRDLRRRRTPGRSPPPRKDGRRRWSGLVRVVSQCHTGGVSDWGRATYGDPCGTCGFRWTTPIDDAVALIRTAPELFRSDLSGASGAERHPDLGWSVAAYVCHVADNLRIWAERLVGVAAGAPSDVAPYNQDLLATARAYDRVQLAAALWSLEHSAADWQVAVGQARHVGVVLRHPERGLVDVVDVVRSNAHDTAHHRYDIHRSLGAGPPA